LKEKIVSRVSEDSCFAWRLSHLFYEETTQNSLDYPEEKLKSISFENLMDRFPAIGLPCLPSGPSYVRNPVTLKSDQISRMLHINCFGVNAMNGTCSFGDYDTILFTTISMFNHSKKPNCGVLHEKYCKDVHLVVVTERIKKGDQLTITYVKDKEALKAKWGICE